MKIEDKDDNSSLHINADGSINVGSVAASAGMAQEDSVVLLRRIVKLLESNATVDLQNRQKVVVEAFIGSGLGIPTTGLDSGVGTPTTNRPTALAPIPAPNAVYWQPVWEGPVDQRYRIMDAAQSNYNLNVRSKLAFT